jgi:hypothetical protein
VSVKCLVIGGVTCCVRSSASLTVNPFEFSSASCQFGQPQHYYERQRQALTHNLCMVSGQKTFREEITNNRNGWNSVGRGAVQGQPLRKLQTTKQFLLLCRASEPRIWGSSLSRSL